MKPVTSELMHSKLKPRDLLIRAHVLQNHFVNPTNVSCDESTEASRAYGTVQYYTAANTVTSTF